MAHNQIRRMEMSKLKILIISPSKVTEPLGAMYLSSALKKAGHNVDGLFTEREENILQSFLEIKPDIVLFSCITGEQNKCVSLNKILKKHSDFISIFGGPHVTFYPQIINEDDIDIVGIGECEEALVELVNKIAHNEDITRIDNFHIKKSGRIFKNKIRRLVLDLDKIRFPDRDLFKKYKSDAEFSIMASRGCFYNCTYCYNKPIKKIYAGKGKFVRFRSIDNIIKECKEIMENRRVEIFHFHDSIFMYHKKRLREFVKKYTKNINIPFFCSLRANCVDMEFASMLKDAGCAKAYIGVETGNDDVRKYLLKRNITKKQIMDAVQFLKNNGIKIFTHNIVGLPRTTIDNDFETLEFNFKLSPDFAHCTIFTPYPGTDLSEIAIKDGVGCDIEKIYSTFHYKTPLNIQHKEEVNILHKLFALTVVYPEIYSKVKDIVRNAKQISFKKYYEIFVLHREYMYEKVISPNLILPEKVEHFLSELWEDEFDLTPCKSKVGQIP